MKFLCDSTNFQNTIQNAYDFCSQKSLSSTSFILLDLNGNNLNVRATDGKIGFDSNIEVEGKKDGSIALPCDKFLNIIKTFSDEKIIVEQKDIEFVTIKSDSRLASFKIKYNNAQTFEKKEEIGVKEHIEIDSKEFVKMINQAIISVSDNASDDTKSIYTGVYLEKKDNNIYMVSTDGKSMSYVEGKIEEKSKLEDKSVIIPNKFLKEVVKIFKNEEILDIYIKDNVIFVRNDDTIIYSVLFKGSFPNYQKVLNTPRMHSIVYKVEDMNRALKSVILMADNVNKKIIIAIKNGVTVISASDNELGSASDEIATDYDGDEVKFAVNYKYIVNQVRAFTCDYFKMEFNDMTTSIKLIPTNEERYCHIIMPMNLD